jgi:hypothetical protein
MRLTTPAFLALTASIAALPAAVCAADLGYTYAEGRYLHVEPDAGNDADGATLIGWYRLNEHLFAIGQVIQTDAGNNVKATTGALGAGLILPLGRQWDAVAIATARRTELDRAAADVHENGYGAQLGLRGMPIPKFEARLFANYVNVIGDDTSFFVSGDYWFSPTFAAGVAAEFGGDVKSYSLGVRYSFGN